MLLTSNFKTLYFVFLCKSNSHCYQQGTADNFLDKHFEIFIIIGSNLPDFHVRTQFYQLLNLYDCVKFSRLPILTSYFKVVLSTLHRETTSMKYFKHVSRIILLSEVSRIFYHTFYFLLFTVCYFTSPM